jgi:anti-sigma-K factor RskA
MTNSENAPSLANPTERKVSSWWRAATVFLAVVIATAIAAGFSTFEVFKAQIEHLQAKLQTVSHIRYIALLIDDQQAPAMLVTFDPQDQSLQLQRLNAVIEGRDDSMQLWALSPGGKPRSLGVLDSRGKTLRLVASDKSFAAVTQLAISVEDKGGVSEATGPRLDYLFKGPLVQKAM